MLWLASNRAENIYEEPVDKTVLSSVQESVAEYKPLEDSIANGLLWDLSPIVSHTNREFPNNLHY
jgi:hypothetical protein